MVQYDVNFPIRPLVTHFMEWHFSTTIGPKRAIFLQLKWKIIIIFCFKLIRKHFSTQVMKNLFKALDSMLVLKVLLVVILIL